MHSYFLLFLHRLCLFIYRYCNHTCARFCAELKAKAQITMGYPWRMWLTEGIFLPIHVPYIAFSVVKAELQLTPNPLNGYKKDRTGEISIAECFNITAKPYLVNWIVCVHF